ncbi:MAG: hypothetical protein KDD60_02400, partial [Bdellovibrionales bacterium]|nr:hypothetical protein [Bdellovibrionales bacterium]
MRPKVAVCFGGVSVEHEVSTISGIQALHAIDQSKYDPFPVYVTKTGRWFVGDGFVGDELGDIKNYSNIDSLLSRCEEVAPRPVRGDTKLYPLKRKLLSFVEGALPVDIYFPVFHGSFGEDGAVQGLFQLMNVPYVGCDVTGAATSMDKIVMKSIFRGVGLPVIESCWFTRFEFEEDERAILQR